MRKLIFVGLFIASSAFADVQMAKKFTIYYDYQQNFYKNYSNAIKNKSLTTIKQAQMNRQLLAKKAEFEKTFGSNISEYNKKYKAKCLDAFMWTSSAFGSLYSWAIREGKWSAETFLTDQKEASAAIKECKSE